jgi:hypothetical protein
LLAFLEYDILKCWHKLKTPIPVVNIFVIWKKRHLTEKIIPNLTLLYIEINIEITFQEDNLISGPMTVNAQRGTCHMSTGCEVPEVKTEKCMHKYHLNMYLYCMHFSVLTSGTSQPVLMWQVPLCALTVIGPEVNTENRCRHLYHILHIQ